MSRVVFLSVLRPDDPRLERDVGFGRDGRRRVLHPDGPRHVRWRHRGRRRRRPPPGPAPVLGCRGAARLPRARALKVASWPSEVRAWLVPRPCCSSPPVSAAVSAKDSSSSSGTASPLRAGPRAVRARLRARPQDAACAA